PPSVLALLLRQGSGTEQPTTSDVPDALLDPLNAPAICENFRERTPLFANLLLQPRRLGEAERSPDGAAKTGAQPQYSAVMSEQSAWTRPRRLGQLESSDGQQTIRLRKSVRITAARIR